MQRGTAWKLSPKGLLINSREKIWLGDGKQNRYPPPFAHHVLHYCKRTVSLPLKSEVISSDFCMRKDTNSSSLPKNCSELDNGRQPSQDSGSSPLLPLPMFMKTIMGALRSFTWDQDSLELLNIQVYCLSWKAGTNWKACLLPLHRNLRQKPCSSPYWVSKQPPWF